jgi:hypothetical protein
VSYDIVKKEKRENKLLSGKISVIGINEVAAALILSESRLLCLDSTVSNNPMKIV